MYIASWITHELIDDYICVPLQLFSICLQCHLCVSQEHYKNTLPSISTEFEGVQNKRGAFSWRGVDLLSILRGPYFYNSQNTCQAAVKCDVTNKPTNGQP